MYRDQLTYVGGHILDLVVTRSSEAIVSGVSVDSLISLIMHHAVHFTVNVTKQCPKREKEIFKLYKSSDKESFFTKLGTHRGLPCRPGQDGGLYDNVLGKLVDNRVPVMAKPVTKRCTVPWFTEVVLWGVVSQW